MATYFKVCVVGGECFKRQKSEGAAKSFARIGSQKGRPREVFRCSGRKKVRGGRKRCARIRRYTGGKRTWPKGG